ncbi:MAG: hypothetical protein GF344_15420 [Chitinivibrionales bacterium]|nr:hypothetical protein [Chitinivibrionales bacterium]MBD3358094.1 hypothetical protein [Chitinivibrionales bacterium]
MADQDTYSVTIRFPGDFEYIPAVRKFVSDILQTSNLDQKFAFRSEIIVDEVCANAVNFGCTKPDAHVELTVALTGDRVEFHIRDEGGRQRDVERLRAAVNEKSRIPLEAAQNEAATEGLGLEIVRMLSEKVDLEIDENNLTSLHVVRRREDRENDLDR